MPLNHILAKRLLEKFNKTRRERDTRTFDFQENNTKEKYLENTNSHKIIPFLTVTDDHIDSWIILYDATVWMKNSRCICRIRNTHLNTMARNTYTNGSVQSDFNAAIENWSKVFVNFPLGNSFLYNWEVDTYCMFSLLEMCRMPLINTLTWKYRLSIFGHDASRSLADRMSIRCAFGR